MVYLIHFDKPFKGCRHYIGYSKDAETHERRIAHHRAGTGARLMRAVTRAGIQWCVARTWPDKSGFFEQALKAVAHSARFCPVCNPETFDKHKDPSC